MQRSGDLVGTGAVDPRHPARDAGSACLSRVHLKPLLRAVAGQHRKLRARRFPGLPIANCRGEGAPHLMGWSGTVISQHDVPLMERILQLPACENLVDGLGKRKSPLDSVQVY